MRSSRLVAALVNGHGLSVDTAKKRASRAAPPIRKFPIRLLPKNEAFLYREDDRNSDAFWDGLVRDLRESGSIYGLAVDGLQARGGIAERPSFNVVSGSAEAQKKQIPLSGVLDNLISAGLAEQIGVGEMDECICLNRHVFDVSSPKTFRVRAIAEDVLMDGLREWARKLGFASYHAIEIRNAENAPKFGNFHWDLCGPSYIHPLVSANGAQRKPGFLVSDVFCGRVLDVPHIQYFLRKVRSLKAMRRVVPFMPVLLADGYTKEAMRVGRGAHVVMATTRNLFGETVAEALGSLIDTLTHAAVVAASNPDQLISLFRNLKAIEGAAGNLRGALFEMIVGYLVREVDGNSIDIGEIIQDPKTGKQAEIDVRRIKERQECWFYECRGRQPNNQISAVEVTDWLKKVDRIWRFHRSETRFQGCAFGFELWTTGSFDSDGLQLLAAEKAKRRARLTLDWRDGPRIRDYAKKAARKSILDTLDQHYFKHPLSVE
jgi:hypothetical protein